MLHAVVKSLPGMVPVESPGFFSLDEIAQVMEGQVLAASQDASPQEKLGFTWIWA